MAKLIGGCVLAVVGVALMGWSLAIGFFDFELLRWAGGLAGFVVLITGVDMARDTPYPWWTGGKPSSLR